MRSLLLTGMLLAGAASAAPQQPDYDSAFAGYQAFREPAVKLAGRDRVKPGDAHAAHGMQHGGHGAHGAHAGHGAHADHGAHAMPQPAAKADDPHAGHAMHQPAPAPKPAAPHAGHQDHEGHAGHAGHDHHGHHQHKE